MAATLRRLRNLTIALAAIIAASLAAGEASACSAMRREAAACATACGCCSSPSDEASASAVAAERAASPRAPATCAMLPRSGCACRSQEPAAPAPRPARTAPESRTEPSQVAYLALPDDEGSARASLASRFPLTEDPPKIPLYLRNERLLF